MNNHKKIVWSLQLVSFVLFSIPAYGMELTLTGKENAAPITKAEDPIYYHFSGNTNLPYKVNEIYENPDLKRIAGEYFVGNQQQSIEKINKKAAEEGAKVHIGLGQHYANDPSAFQVTTLKRHPTHAKMTAGILHSPTKDKSHQKGILMIGSGNLSNHTWENPKLNKKIRFNPETLIETNNPELAEQAYIMSTSSSPFNPNEDKAHLLTSPKKATLISTRDTNINKTIAERILTVSKSKNEPRIVRIRTMNCNDTEIIDAAIAAKTSGADVEMIVNYTALTKNGLPLLQKLAANDIPVYVFVPAEGSHVCHHSKAFDIINGDKYTHIENTGNMTEECAKQINYSLILPNEKQVVLDSIADFEIVKEKICVPLAKAIKLKQKSDKKKAEKKEAEKLAASKQEEADKASESDQPSKKKAKKEKTDKLTESKLSDKKKSKKRKADKMPEAEQSNKKKKKTK